jgi:hypothetical protein
MTRKPAPVVRRRTSVVRGSLITPPSFGASIVAGLVPPVLSGRSSILEGMSGLVPPILSGHTRGVSGWAPPVLSGRSSMVGGMPGRGPSGQPAPLAATVLGVMRLPTRRMSMLVGVKGVQLPPVAVVTQTTSTAGADETDSEHATLLPPVIGQPAVRGAAPLIELSTFYAPRSGNNGSDGDTIINSDDL